MTIAELRRIRMAKGLSLTEISRRTRIGIGYLRKIEEGSLSALPPGFYARAFVRAYTEAIGVDADVVLGELADELPAAQAATAPHPAGPAASSASVTSASELVPDARMHVLKQILERHNTLVNKASAVAATRVPPSMASLAKPGRRLMAATIDGLLMVSLYGGVIALTAWACGVSVAELVRISGLAITTVLGLITILYVVMMGGIAGHTIGSMLLDVPLGERPATPLQLGAIFRRSLRFVHADAASAAEVVSLLTRTRRAA
jgi:transcriptional regulator with XRE-family HTH domain